MDPLLMLLIVALIAVAAAIVVTFNSLIVARQRVDNSWAQIDVQLKKRADLVPNLIEIVKGYAKHERETLEKVTECRAKVMSAQEQTAVMAESNALAGGIGSVFAVAESYPDLKADQEFVSLQKKLADLEDSIAYARMVYNDVVTIYNTKIATFPRNMIAGILGFKERKYLDEGDLQPVKVRF